MGPNVDGKPAGGQGLQRISLAGIGLGAATVLACELPIILALIGLGGAGAGATVFRPHTVVELIGIAFAVMGVALLIGLALHRRRTNRRRAQ